jgi:hypothetical protein
MQRHACINKKLLTIAIRLIVVIQSLAYEQSDAFNQE